jgi:hypothetical protein
MPRPSNKEGLLADGLRLVHERGLDDAHLPEPKLRGRRPTKPPHDPRIRFHENMQVPEASLVTAAYNGPVDRADGQESLEIWQTSDGGSIGRGRLGIEALRRGDEVWCLVRLHSAALGSRTFTGRDELRHEHGGQAVASRSLNDLLLTGGGTISVEGSRASALIVKAPTAATGCAHPKVKFTNSRIVLSQPSAIYGSAAAPTTETVDLAQNGDYRLVGGNVGCPQCGNLYAADLTRKLTQRVWKIHSVDTAVHAGNWKRCHVDIDVCGSAGEFTVTENKSSTTCVNGSTCYVWRWQRPEDAGGAGSDKVTLAYYASRCERYCPW